LNYRWRSNHRFAGVVCCLLLQTGLVKLVADYVIKHHYPHLMDGEQQQQQQQRL
jgi:hypothetical protein